MREENTLLVDEIQNLELQREEIIEIKKQREIERQQKLIEEEAKKNVKKAGKKWLLNLYFCIFLFNCKCYLWCHFQWYFLIIMDFFFHGDSI